MKSEMKREMRGREDLNGIEEKTAAGSYSEREKGD